MSTLTELRKRRFEQAWIYPLCLAAPVLWAGVVDAVPYLWFVLVQAWFLFAVMVTAHEAVHGAAHRHRGWNRAIGWIGGLMVGASFDLQRRLHLAHHRGDASADMERRCVSDGPIAYRLLKRFVGFAWCYGMFPTMPRREQARAIAVAAALGLIAIASPMQVLFLWLLPLMLASFGFVSVFVVLPHSDSAFAEWVRARAPWMTNYHDVHHEHPELPWFLGRAAYRQGRSVEDSVALRVRPEATVELHEA